MDIHPGISRRNGGLDDIYQLGGAQAIAAMAFGTESVPRVDTIVGAGNIFVTLAKQQVFGIVGLDRLFGPTETMVIADESASPTWVAADLLAQSMELSSRIGGRLDLERIYFLGAGHQYGLANEGMLKMTEMSLTISDAFYFMEFRHGPKSMADEQALIVGLLSKESFSHEHQVLQEMRELGALSLGLNASGQKSDCDFEITLPADLPAWLAPIIYLPPLQLLAYYRAMAKGLDPDAPRNLTAVITLNLE